MSSRRRKFTLAMLLLYWPALFILAHIPVPRVVYKAQISDKTLHFIAYMILAFLLWCAIKPNTKVNWRKSPVWWVLFVVVWYGVIDEWFQAQVGRSCDVMDFLADVSGAVAGLLVLSFLYFWPACLTVAGVSIFLSANLARTNISELLPVTNIAIHFFSYAIFTYLWIQNLGEFSAIKAPCVKRLIVSLAVPVGFMVSVKFVSVMLGKKLSLHDVVTSVAAIVAVVSLIAFLQQKLARKPS